MNTVTYVVSLLTFYLKGEIRSEQNFVVFQEPNTVLGLIPGFPQHITMWIESYFISGAASSGSTPRSR